MVSEQLARRVPALATKVTSSTTSVSYVTRHHSRLSGAGNTSPFPFEVALEDDDEVSPCQRTDRHASVRLQVPHFLSGREEDFWIRRSWNDEDEVNELEVVESLQADWMSDGASDAHGFYLACARTRRLSVAYPYSG